jgi:CelD/BcsL family acetyltransferase involved in cellulose biosynthesis
MHLRLIDREADFDALENAWNRLSEAASVSIFSSFDYVHTAWRHFHSTTDRLCILVLSDGPSILGIAPFCIKRSTRRGIPHRILRFIAAWEGDCPDIIAVDRTLMWTEIFTFLRAERMCDVVDLMEQPREGPDGRHGLCLPRSGWHWESSPDGVDYYIPLTGNWDEYLKHLEGRTRHEYHRKLRRLSAITGGYRIDRISDPDRMREGFRRFVAIERQSWKVEAGIGAAKDERHTAFYEDLLVRLSATGRALMVILVGGGQDMAANMVFVQRDVVYSRHLVFAQLHAAYSPGLLVHAEVFKGYFGTSFREFDMLALRESGNAPRHKADWSKGRRETVHWTGYRTRGRLFPLIAAKRLKARFTRLAPDEPDPSRGGSA